MSSSAPTGNTTILLASAEEIACRIHREAISTGDGGACWSIPSGEQEPAGPYLYAGITGVALFLAACHGVLGGKKHKDLALRALVPLRNSFPRPGNERIGGLAGLGSLVWAFLRIGLLLDEESLVIDAHAVAQDITPERITADRSLDILLGTAGALLALLALERLGGEATREGPSPLERACSCARHLMAKRISYPGLPRAWAPEGRMPFSGFAHGAAGISYALLRLFEQTGDPELKEAAEEGFAFERALYSPEKRNWPDRPGPAGVFMKNWCYGAPGIALGRLGLPSDDGADSRLHDETRDALQATRVLALTPTDHLCCGNAGRIEILHTASRCQGDHDLLRASVTLAIGLIRRAQVEGHLRLVADPADSTFDPGLFKGASGVGYTFLRLASPNSLPSVLLLE